eukprot:Skav202835  [mRNA]  locus=scaffold746:38224:38580:+ [translate_table: standard]
MSFLHSQDLYGLLLLRVSAAAQFLQAILETRTTPETTRDFLGHFDVKKLHRALELIDDPSAPTVIKVLDKAELQRCHRCGAPPGPRALQTCGHCKRVAYCSRECQRADWKLHKLKCQC